MCNLCISIAASCRTPLHQPVSSSLGVIQQPLVATLLRSLVNPQPAHKYLHTDRRTDARIYAMLIGQPPAPPDYDIMASALSLLIAITSCVASEESLPCLCVAIMSACDLQSVARLKDSVIDTRIGRTTCKCYRYLIRHPNGYQSQSYHTRGPELAFVTVPSLFPISSPFPSLSFIYFPFLSLIYLLLHFDPVGRKPSTVTTPLC